MANPKGKQNQSKDAERVQETSKAAQKALDAEKQAKELTQAAAGAGDPDERQKLLNEALEKQVEAETFGKTAKYLQTGAFQGLCAGAGLGTGIGVSLGAVTGTIVGGTTSLVTGGLGAGLGLGVGAAHGPWFKIGDMMGEGIRKVTGDLPGWKATEEQKEALEKMVSGVREQERPQEDELVQMSGAGGKVAPGKAYTGQRKEDEKEKGILQGELPSTPSLPNSTIPGMKSNKKNQDNQNESKVKNAVVENTQPAQQISKPSADLAGKAATPSTAKPSPQNPGSPQSQSNTNTSVAPRNAPRKIAKRGNGSSPAQVNGQAVVDDTKGNAVNQQVQQTDEQGMPPKKPPRKLEVRSKKAS